MRYILLAYAFMVAVLIHYFEPLRPVEINRSVISDVRCLTDNIYHEARGESRLGQLAVAQVTLNRSRLQKRSICAIVYQTNQFSWVGKVKEPNRASTLWKHIENLAKQAIERKIVLYPLQGVTHFHTIDVLPDWAETHEFVVEIGRHRFYK